MSRGGGGGGGHGACRSGNETTGDAPDITRFHVQSMTLLSRFLCTVSLRFPQRVPLRRLPSLVRAMAFTAEERGSPYSLDYRIFFSEWQMQCIQRKQYPVAHARKLT